MQLGVRDVAGLLEVSEKTVYRWIEDGKLPGYRISGQYRFNRAELLAWATAEKIHISPQIYAEPAVEKEPLPSVEEALLAGGIYYRISGDDPASCLRHVVETLRLPEEVDREFLLQVLLARESLESTGIGNGIAIPHMRNPIVLHLPRPLIALCFLEHPVDFKSLDGKPVHALFTLITPSIKTHLHLLSRLSFLLKEPEFFALVQEQAARAKILEHIRRLQPATTAEGPGSPAPLDSDKSFSHKS